MTTLALGVGQPFVKKKGSGVAAPPFDPTSVGGLISWLDASNASNFTYSSGTSVSYWDNKAYPGTSTRALSQGVVSNQPSRSGIQNGLATVVFNNDYVQDVNGGGWWPMLHDGTDYTIFTVAKATGTHTYTALWGTAQIGIGTNLYGQTGLSYVHQVHGGATGDVVGTGHGPYPMDKHFLITVAADPNNVTAAERSSISINKETPVKNNSVTGTPSAAAASNGFTLGMRNPADSSTWLNGEIAECLVYMGTLTAGDRLNIENYLISKWNINTAVPSIPTDITGLSAWFDGSDASTFSYSSGVEISQWNDKSGLNNHAVQATVANQPNLIAGGLNGKSVVSFLNAESMSHILPHDTTTKSIDIIAIAKRNDPAADYCHIWYNDSYGVAFSNMAQYFSSVRQGLAWVNTSWASDLSFHRAESQWLVSNQSINMWLDALSYTSGTGLTLLPGTNPHLSIIGSARPVVIAELIIYVTPNGISFFDRTKIREYLTTKWGIG